MYRSRSSVLFAVWQKPKHKHFVRLEFLISLHPAAFPLTSNSEPIDQRIRAVHTALLGAENVIELPTIMYSEDFSQYGLPGRHHYGGEPIPYCYLGIWRSLTRAL